MLLSVLLAANIYKASSGTINELPKHNAEVYMQSQFIRHLQILAEEAKQIEDISKFLKNKKDLTKYFKKHEREKVTEICKRLQIEDKWLYLIIWYESRGNPKAQNPWSKATGIIQFMPRTAKNLGTTTQELYDMSVIDQLDYVEKYFNLCIKRYGRLNSYTDAYLAVFSPSALGKSSDYIIGIGVDVNRDGIVDEKDLELIRKQNPHVDRDGDGIITVADFRSYANT